MTKYSAEDRDNAREYLAARLQPGMTVHTVLRHVSTSGMSRWISLMIPSGDGEGITDLSWHGARLIGLPVNSRNHEGVHAEGCGMDMGFHLVYSLSRALWPEGFDCVSYYPARQKVTYRRCEHCPASESRSRPDAICRQAPDGTGDYLPHHFIASGEPYRAIDPDRPRRQRAGQDRGCPANDHFNCSPRETPYHHSDGGYALRHRWL